MPTDKSNNSTTEKSQKNTNTEEYTSIDDWEGVFYCPEPDISPFLEIKTNSDNCVVIMNHFSKTVEIEYPSLPAFENDTTYTFYPIPDDVVSQPVNKITDIYARGIEELIEQEKVSDYIVRYLQRTTKVVEKSK